MTRKAATIRFIIGRVEHDLSEMGRRSGHCALCKSAELRRVLGELRVLLRDTGKASPLAANP